MYSNSLTQSDELEDVFCKSEILYLIEHRNDDQSDDDADDDKLTYSNVTDAIKHTVNQYKQTETTNHKDLKQVCLNLWFHCMGWASYQKGDDILQFVDKNCNELYTSMSQNYTIRTLMSLLKICLGQHKQSIDSLLEETQGVVDFNHMYLNHNNNANIQQFWNTFEILSICMNSILCIAWSQRNSPQIKQNALFIEEFHIDKEPLFVHLFNYIAQDNYCQTMPIKKFVIYIRWHLFFTNDTANKLDHIATHLQSNKSKTKCAVSDFFDICNVIDTKHSPLLVLPPSIHDANKQKHKEEDAKYDENEQVEYVRPMDLDYKYPVHKLPTPFQFEASNPRIELFGQAIVPKEKVDLLEQCNAHLPNRSMRHYNMYACDVYRYIALKARVPDWILMQQNKDNTLQHKKKDVSPKWLQNIRMGLGIKMWIKLLCSAMPSSYRIDTQSNEVMMRITNVPDVRYEVVASIFRFHEDDGSYFMELQRHQKILIFNIIGVLLALLKLFKTHEVLQFEYLKHLIQKDNGVIVLCKVFTHPWKDRKTDVFLTKPETFVECKDRQQLMDKIYRAMDEQQQEDGSYALSSRVLTFKVNALRIVQKCVKYSYGHCRILCDVLRCHVWMTKYLEGSDDVMDYYVLKIYKSMMPFLDQTWREQKRSKAIIELIRETVRIGVNDQWLSYSIAKELSAVTARYKEKEEMPHKLKLHEYYQWLGLKEPVETDYADGCFNPFFVRNDYGAPRQKVVATKEWMEMMDDACSVYHEWLFEQIKCDDKEFAKQEKYIGMTRKEMETQKMIERSSRVDQGLDDIKVPKDFDFNAYLRAYFKGTQDELLDKI
eukprot:83698_1